MKDLPRADKDRITNALQKHTEAKARVVADIGTDTAERILQSMPEVEQECLKLRDQDTARKLLTGGVLFKKSLKVGDSRNIFLFDYFKNIEHNATCVSIDVADCGWIRALIVDVKMTGITVNCLEDDSKAVVLLKWEDMAEGFLDDGGKKGREAKLAQQTPSGEHMSLSQRTFLKILSRWTPNVKADPRHRKQRGSKITSKLPDATLYSEKSCQEIIQLIEEKFETFEGT